MLTALLDNKYLIRELVARDVRTRYIGSLLGVFWSVLNPLLQLALYTVIFSLVLKVPIEDGDSVGRFAEYLFCALLPWMSLQEAVTRSCRTFIENSVLIKKVRFPLEVLPLGVVFSALLHQLLGTVIFAIVLWYNGSLRVDLMGLVVLLFMVQIVFIYGLSLVVACLNVFFRDILQVLGVAFMLAFWATPIVYSKGRAPEVYRWILDLNPLTHMVEAYRFVFLGKPVPSTWGLVYWIAIALAAYGLGRYVLRRTRNDLVDLI